MGATALIAATAVTALSKIGAGNAKKAEADYSAGVLDQEAGQTVASSIQGMLIERRRKDQVASAAKASLAASGATSTDPSAVKVRGQIEGAGEYQALTKLYEGEDQAIQLRSKATSLRSTGKADQTAGYFGAVSSIFSGGGSWFDKYGGDAATAT